MNLKLRQWILSADLLWIVMSVGLVQLLQNGLTPEPEALAPSVYASAVLVAASIWTVLYFSKNLEGFCLGWYLPRVFAQVIVGVFYVMGSLLAFGFLSKHFYSRLALLYLACLLPVGFITILGWRVAVHIQTIHPERDFVPSATELSPECFSPIPTQHCCGKDQKRSAEDQQT